MKKRDESKAKAPASWWYWGDWKRDVAVQSCCLAARGLWFEMLHIMRDAEPYGFLAVGGRPLSENHLARMVGAETEEVTRLLSELDAAGVFSRDGSGTIYSRRLQREAQQKANKQKAGKASADKALRLSEINRQSTDSQQNKKRSAYAEAEAEVVRFGFEEETAIPPVLDVPAFRQALADWFDYRRERGLSSWVLRTITAKLAEMAEWGPAVAVASIRESIGNNWQGIFKSKRAVAATSDEDAEAIRRRIFDALARSEKAGADRLTINAWSDEARNASGRAKLARMLATALAEAERYESQARNETTAA